MNYYCLSVWLMACVVVVAEEPAQFADESLKYVIGQHLNTKNPTRADLLGLTDLWLDDSVRDLSGIELAINLEELSLPVRKLNYTPLTRLAKLRKLEFHGYDYGMILKKPEPNRVEILPDLSGLPTLKHLVLKTDSIRDISALKKLPNLRQLTLNNSPDIDFAPIAELKNLTCLEICNCDLNDLSFLSTLGQLEELVITHHEKRELDLTPLTHLDNLERLEVCYNAIQDISPLAHLNQLKRLFLDNNEITDISALAGLTGLTKLSLAGNRIEDISALTHLKQLDVLVLYGNPLKDAAYTDHLPAIMRNNPEVGIHCYVQSGNSLKSWGTPVLLALGIIIIIGLLIWSFRQKKRFYRPVTIGALILLLAPLPVRTRDLEQAVAYSVRSLIDDQPVLILNKGYRPFYDSMAFNRYIKLCYHNDIPVDNRVYEELDLIPYESLDSKDQYWDFSKYLVLGFSDKCMMDESGKARHLHFDYQFGILGGLGYRMVVYRTLFRTYVFYWFEWVS